MNLLERKDLPIIVRIGSHLDPLSGVLFCMGALFARSTEVENDLPFNSTLFFYGMLGVSVLVFFARVSLMVPYTEETRYVRRD